MIFNAILFDLDGTLLPHSFDDFIPRYFGALQKKFSLFFPSDRLIESIIRSTQEMMDNNGTRTNKEAFWANFSTYVGLPREELEPLFEQFYLSDFPKLGQGFQEDPSACRLIAGIKQAKRKVILATNPVFPSVAIQERLKWIGLDPATFDFITSFEDMHFCKPKPDFYSELADKINERPENCLMVGNDVELDLRPAFAVGMQTYLVDNDFQIVSDNLFTPDFAGDLADVLKLI